MKILSIDIGINNLAMVVCSLDTNYLSREEIILDREIIFCDLINITDNNCHDVECKLHHDKVMCDYIMHLFKNYREYFETSDVILIERQPLTGLVSIQELIMREYRDKSFLISPISMLKFFDLLQYKYEDRKVRTERIASKYLSSFKEFVFNERRHDMADAFCIMYYYIYTKKKEYVEIMKERQFIKDNQQYLQSIQSFKYVG